MKNPFKKAPQYLALCCATMVVVAGFAQKNSGKWTASLFEQYDKFKEPGITHRRFKHKDIVPLIQQSSFPKEVVGQSFEERDIYQVSMGKGKTKVLLWSQMHGDEATATMALMDIFRFFEAKNDGFDTLRKRILDSCTLHFVPMLNPDGAERFQRRTALEIDMNRDAVRLQTPEGVLLKRLQNAWKPDFAFNLHDQGVRTSVGKTGKQATISFLATAFDAKRSWNAVRRRSMQVVCHMNDVLQKFIPGHVAKYSDEFEPRAFGDNIQKWGSSLILIESGGYKDDVEKQFIRKLNFVAILSALESIASKKYARYERPQYNAIPNNANNLYNLLVRNAEFVERGKTIIKDIGVNQTERNLDNATAFVTDGRVEELGDLTIFAGIKEIDATGMTVRFPKDFPNEMQRYKLTDKQKMADSLKRGEDATFILEKNGAIQYVVINGIVQQ